MIFYFSGTGNSLFFAKGIADSLGEKLSLIPAEIHRNSGKIEYELSGNETLGFVFPVYAWGPPKMVLDFLSELTLIGLVPYVFSVCTCGEEEGHTTRILRKALSRRGLTLDSAFTVRMPNNYVIGYDVDSAPVEQDKLMNAGKQFSAMLEIISKRQKGVNSLIQGSLPAIKVNGKPSWGKNCTQCLGCLNRCPVHAIQYGKGTENRGRYMHPILRRG